MKNTFEGKTTLTWKERVMAATTGRNDRGVFLWYSHDRIYKLIEDQCKAEGLTAISAYRSLSSYLVDMVKSGHLQRALKPQHLSKKVRYDGRPEYLYRQTGKKFSPQYDRLKSLKNEHSPKATRNAILAHELWRVHRRLPRWFRRMMLD